MKHHEAAPITPDRLASRREHLMTEILQAPGALPTRHSRPRLRMAVAAVTVAALTVGVSFLANTGGGPTGNGPAAFAIERLPDGPVRIRIIHTDLAAKEMTRQLHAQGLNITVTAIPASPQLVGTWFAWGGSGGEDQADMATMAAEMADQESTIEIPAGLLAHGSIDLDFGRPTRPGEQPAAMGAINALSPRGRFYCLQLTGAPPAVAQAKLNAAGYRVHFSPPAGGPSHSVLGRTWADYRDTPPPGLVVSAKWEIPGLTGFTDKDVFVVVLPPDAPNYQANLWQNFPKSDRDSGVRDYSSCPAS